MGAPARVGIEPAWLDIEDVFRAALNAVPRKPSVADARGMVIHADRTAAVKVGDGARMVFGSRDGDVVMSAFDGFRDGVRLMIRRLRLSDGVHALVVAERLIDGEVSEIAEGVDLWVPAEAG